MRRPPGKGRVGGCRQRIRYCEEQLEQAARACEAAPTLRGQRLSWTRVQRLLVKRNRLAQELHHLTHNTTP